MKMQTKTAKIGSLKIGSKYPVRIKGMLKTPIHKIDELVAEACALEAEGAQAIRMAVKELSAAKVRGSFRGKVGVPFVADIHFDHRLALAAIENGFEGVRLNPLNVTKKADILEVVRLAKRNGVSIRVGVNSGGFKRKFSSIDEQARVMVKAATDYIKVLESMILRYHGITWGADVLTTIAANRFAKRSRYPLHLGLRNRPL